MKVMDFYMRRPIQQKIFYAIVGLIAMVSVFMLSYFPRNLNDLSYKGLLRESSTMTKLIAFSSISGVEFEDKKLVSDIFKSAQINKNLEFLMIYRADKTPFLSWQEERAQGIERSVPKESAQYTQDNLLVLVEPIVSAGEVLAYAMAGFNLKEIEVARNTNLYTIVSITIALLIIAAFFARTVGLLITKPIEAVISGSQQIASGNYDYTIVTDSVDETGVLAGNFNLMAEAVRNSRQQLIRKNREIQVILDNVAFGLLRIGKSGKILPGYSQSCRSLLLNDAQGELADQDFKSLLKMDSRMTEHFAVMCDQVFDVPDLAEELARQIPKLVSIFDRDIAILCFPIIVDDSVESMLIVLSDITERLRIERENDSNKALVRIIQNKSRFRRLLSDIIVGDKLDELINDSRQRGQLAEASILEFKRSLHTWKGDFSAFGLTDISKFLHEMESRLIAAGDPSQVGSIIGNVRNQVNSFLDEHYQTLRLAEDNIQNKVIELTTAELDQLKVDVEKSASKAEIQHVLRKFISDCQKERASDLLAYLSDTTIQTASNLGKDVKIQINGGQIRLPLVYERVYGQLLHLLRNAVDHGIESPQQRGQKPATALIEISVLESPENFTITISDDGSGIDLDRLKMAAIRSGTSSEEKWSSLNREEQLDFIFLSGVSTKAESVTMISGRGIGLNAVKQAIVAAGGTIQVESRPQLGTTFTIKLSKDIQANVTRAIA